MSGEKKSTYRQMAEAVTRFKNKADTLREQGEKIGTEVTRSVIGGVSAFAVGLGDQRYGAADETTGIRVHKVNGAPTALLAGLGLKGAALFGVFGKAELAAFGAGDGAFNGAANTWGRMAGERLRRKAEQTTKVEAKTDTQAASTAVTKSKAA